MNWAPIRGGFAPCYEILYPLEPSPPPLLLGIPGRPFIPPIAILFETDGILKSYPPREPIPPPPLMPDPDDPMLP